MSRARVAAEDPDPGALHVLDGSRCLATATAQIGDAGVRRLTSAADGGRATEPQGAGRTMEALASLGAVVSGLLAGVVDALIKHAGVHRESKVHTADAPTGVTDGARRPGRTR